MAVNQAVVDLEAGPRVVLVAGSMAVVEEATQLRYGVSLLGLSGNGLVDRKSR